MVSMPNTEVHYLKSKINEVKYKIYISYPGSYKDSLSKKYPVLYLLDADYSFPIAKSITDHLAGRNHLQELIVVGIAYAGHNKYRIHRTRDYTPTNSSENVWFRDIQEKYSGGAPKFSAFLEKELVPFIDKNHRTTSFRAITGHSYGGLFSSWMLITSPHVFNGYIVVSPSLWYDDKMIFKIDRKDFKKKTKVYFAVGDREINNQWNMPEDLERFVNKLNSDRFSKLNIKHDIGKNETHNSIFPFALSNGIRFIFDGI